MWIKEGKRIIRKSYGNYSNLVESREGDLIMTKSWRPKGWSVKEIYLESIGTSLTITGWDAKMIELGADAMLKALRVRKGQTDNPWDYIPDDEEVAND